MTRALIMDASTQGVKLLIRDPEMALFNALKLQKQVKKNLNKLEWTKIKAIKTGKLRGVTKIKRQLMDIEIYNQRKQVEALTFIINQYIN